MARVSARGAGVVMLVLCAIPAFVIGFGTTGIVEPAAPRPAIRAGLGVLWFGVQAASLASAFMTSGRGFAAVCGLTTLIGMVVMAIGRSGIGGVPSALSFALPLIVVYTASAVWLSFRRRDITHTQTAWRCFMWLASIGVVYLFAAVPGAAQAQAGALTVSLAACGAAALLWPALLRVMVFLGRLRPEALSWGAWGAAATMLFTNGVIAWRNGFDTPQVVVGPISLAPYFIAAGLALAGAAMDAHAARCGDRFAWVRTLVGAGLCAVLYEGLMNEAGTAAVLIAGILVVYLISAPAWLAATSVGVLFLGQLVLQAPAVIAATGLVSARVEERLLVWTNRTEPPDQLERVIDTAGLSGATGHVGAARLQFVVGPQVSKDYMPAQILAQGGWLGAVVALLGLLLLIAQVYQSSRRTASPALAGIQIAVVGLLLGNVLVSTLWMADVAPFVGVPLPLLGRAGSHLLGLALLLLVCDAASEIDVRIGRERTIHAA